jgi:DNA invertase Pin-like site-specific DNA recombinase
MNDQPLIHERHRQRLAYVYIRQSTLRQVAEHQESQQLQYQLAGRAQGLGWPEERIVVIDEDLGKSAISRCGRFGFQRLFTDVGTGKVGMLLVTDVSRLARNCADWYQLLDVAALNDVLVCDAHAIYNPRAYDDRLLLGVKGAFSEAQWYIMRQQLQAARLNKARRGELALRLAVGYERLPNGQVIFWPDQQVQGAVHLVFDLFRRRQSSRAVLRDLRAGGLRLPRQARNALGQTVIVWDEASYSQVYQILKLPLYAGAYAYGKRQRQQLPGQPGTQYGRRLPPEEWEVLLLDVFPAYITWEEYLANQQILAQNWQAGRFANTEQPALNLGYHNPPARHHSGAAGKGRALLSGLLLCGRCGRRLRVRYANKPAYVCEATKTAYDEPRCQYLPYAHVDQAVVTAFLAAVQPAAVAATLAAMAEIEAQERALAGQWQQQLARARHQSTTAQARYEQVDPQLRLVAAELERAWEEALQAEVQLQQEWQRLQVEQLQPLSAEDEALIRQMAEDLPALWAASTTTIPDRKRLLRTLIADVTLEGGREPGRTHIAIRWQSGAVSHLTAARPQPGHPSNPTLLARVRALAGEGRTDSEMAALLNQEGLVSSWHVKDDLAYVAGQPVTYWDAARVRHLRNKHKIAVNPTGELATAETAAEALGVSVSVLLDWFRRGLLPGKQERPGAPVGIALDEALRYRVGGRAPRQLPFLAETQPEMVPLPQVGSHFGLEPEEVTAALKGGRFLTWRLEHGRHYRWYLQEKEAESTEPADLLSK